MGMLNTNNIYERLSHTNNLHCNAVVAIKWQKVVQVGTLHDMYMLYKYQISFKINRSLAHCPKKETYC